MQLAVVDGDAARAGVVLAAAATTSGLGASPRPARSFWRAQSDGGFQTAAVTGEAVYERRRGPGPGLGALVYVGGVFGNVAVGGKTYKQPKFVKFAPA